MDIYRHSNSPLNPRALVLWIIIHHRVHKEALREPVAMWTATLRTPVEKPVSKQVEPFLSSSPKGNNSICIKLKQLRNSPIQRSCEHLFREATLHYFNPPGFCILLPHLYIVKRQTQIPSISNIPQNLIKWPYAPGSRIHSKSAFSQVNPGSLPSSRRGLPLPPPPPSTK